MICETLKHLRCDIIAGASLVVNRSNRCEQRRFAWCYNYGWVAYENGWEAQETDFGLCSYEPGESHADSLLMSLRRAPCYARNCGVDNQQWRKAMRRERNL